MGAAFSLLRILANKPRGSHRPGKHRYSVRRQPFQSFLSFLYFFFFWDRISIRSPQTLNPPASASAVQELQACSTKFKSLIYFIISLFILKGLKLLEDFLLGVNVFFLTLFTVFVYVQSHVTHYLCCHQRTSCRSCFSPFPMRVLVNELQPSGLAAGDLLSWPTCRP